MCVCVRFIYYDSSSLWVSTLTRPLHQFCFPHKKQFFKCPHTVWKLSFNKYTDSPGRNRSHIYLCLFTTTRGMFDQEPFSLTKIIRNKKKMDAKRGWWPFHYFFIYTHSGGSRCRASVIKMYVPRAGRPKI